MGNRLLIFRFIFLTSILFFQSCESDSEKKLRLYYEEQAQIEREKIEKDRAQKEAYRQEELRIEQERKEEELRLARIERDKYINNQLPTGAPPYSKYYGGNSRCNSYGCSQIKVKTSNSDVIVTIKKNGKVYRHAYIKAGDQYTFSFPDGTYQAFFYYGKGWNPNKEMKGGQLKGGFIENEEFGKDDPQILQNSTLTYELILQANGNFQTRSSDSYEAL